MEASTATVRVTNISPSASQKTGNDFFSFCGKISRLSLSPTVGGDGSLESVVLFESESAAKTALLLTNAMIVDKSIKVEPLPTSKASPPATAHIVDIANKSFDVQDSERSKTSVVASLLAAGYGVGSDTLSKAKEDDDKHMVTQSLKAGVAQVQAKAQEIDAQYHISENVSAVAKQVTSTVVAVDQSLGISKTVTAAVTSAKNATVAAGTVVASKAMANETIATSVKKVQDTASATKAVVTQKIDDLKSETSAQIEARKNATAATTPGAVTDGTTTNNGASTVASNVTSTIAPSVTTTTPAPSAP